VGVYETFSTHQVGGTLFKCFIGEQHSNLQNLSFEQSKSVELLTRYIQVLQVEFS
jgi:hypothetical protein